jgi:hypothetical protein
MTDLSTRIENVLAGCHAAGGTTFSALADAVIRELGLQRDEEYELGSYTPSGRYRYVTEFESNYE